MSRILNVSNRCNWRSWAVYICFALAMAAFPAGQGRAAENSQQARAARLMDRLIAAYPEHLKGHSGNELIWHDGSRMTFDDGQEKDFKARLQNPDIEDQFSIAYPAGEMHANPELNADPGRFRNDAFFTKIYGDCRKGNMEKRLVKVVWLRNHGAKMIHVSPVNGVAAKLQAVSDELDKLPEQYMRYLNPIGGTFNCRKVAGTKRLSAHSYGIAIDINSKFGDYWRWGKVKGRGKARRILYRNRVPWKIAEIFEKHGFIWGAKWYHYDSFHFEYRPELFNGPKAGVGASSPNAPGADVPTAAPVPKPEK
ncbi:MAG: M15 family metallopeptidase [Alphaproteobacteria bacterium]